MGRAVRFTCEGEDISPPLQWSGPPQGAQSFVLLLDDPDAPSGRWHHWAVYDIPAHIRRYRRTSLLEKTFPVSAKLSEILTGRVMPVHALLVATERIGINSICLLCP
nr:YbhB/YbcL family Raf kinase inhibitor-like protein [Rhizobium binae]